MDITPGDLVGLLRKVGFEFDSSRGKGSHGIVYYRYQGRVVLQQTVPRTLKKGTLSAILRRLCLRDAKDRFLAGMVSADEFEAEYLRLKDDPSTQY